MFLTRKQLHRYPNEELEDDPLYLFEQALKTQFNMDRLKEFLLKYKKDERYINSPRYLRLWIMYALYLETAAYVLPILYCLIDNHIGDKLAMLYETIAYYQIQQNRFKEAEDILLLGIKQRAQPTARLERVLNQYYSNKTIPFNKDQYTIASYQHHSSSIFCSKESSLILKEQSIENQLQWLDVALGHSIRASVLRECHQTGQNDLSFEELRVKYLNDGFCLQTKPAPSSFVKEVKSDLDDIYHALKQRRADAEEMVHKKITPPNTAQTPPPPQRRTTTPALGQAVVQTKPTIPTNPQEETANVTQLPHKSGFIQIQLSSHGILEHDDYHIFKTKRAKEVQNKLRAWSSASSSNTSSGNTHHQRIIKLGEENYHVVRKLGEGGMARVYLVENTNNHAYYGLKVQQPPHPWEFYIISQLHKRRKTIEKQNHYLHVLPVHHFYQYDDISFLVMPYIKNGTLLDALNLYRTHLQEAAMPEFVVLLFMLQLLKEITTLHGFHITHNDLKLDNIMLTRNKNDRRKLRLPTVFMVDYGRSVDLTVLESTKCKAHWKPACPQSDYPLLNQAYSPIHADYWQLATMAHLLLFGEPMKYMKQKGDTYRIQQSIKRYWHKDLWTKFFHTMLNLQQVEQSNCEVIQDLIHDFEQLGNDVPATLIHGFHDLLDKN